MEPLYSPSIKEMYDIITKNTRNYILSIENSEKSQSEPFDFDDFDTVECKGSKPLERLLNVLGIKYNEPGTDKSDSELFSIEYGLIYNILYNIADIKEIKSKKPGKYYTDDFINDQGKREIIKLTGRALKECKYISVIIENFLKDPSCRQLEANTKDLLFNIQARTGFVFNFSKKIRKNPYIFKQIFGTERNDYDLGLDLYADKVITGQSTDL